MDRLREEIVQGVEYPIIRPVSWHLSFVDGDTYESAWGDWAAVSDLILIDDVYVWQTTKPVGRLLLKYGSEKLYQIFTPDTETLVFSYSRFASCLTGAGDLWLQSVFGFLVPDFRVLYRVSYVGLQSSVEARSTPFLP